MSYKIIIDEVCYKAVKSELGSCVGCVAKFNSRFCNELPRCSPASVASRSIGSTTGVFFQLKEKN